MAPDSANREKRSVVVLDTSVLINFLNVERLDLLVRQPGYEFLVTDHVRGEVVDPAQRAVVDTALQCGHLLQTRVDAAAEIEAFAKLVLTRVLGDGECAALAVAVCRGMAIAIDDRLARKKASALFGFERFVGTADLVVAAIRGGVIDVGGADELKERWAERHKFRLGFGSFGDVS